MPEHIKSAPNSKEFQQYLNNFVKKKERQHRKKVLQQVATSIALMIAG
jgi:hypothetical protein